VDARKTSAAGIVPPVVDVSEATWETDVVARSAEVPVVVDFWADWCGPCHMLAPVLEQAVADREGRVALAKVDVDANQALASRFGVQGIPAVKAFKDGRVVAEFTGVRSAQYVADFLDALGQPSEAERLVEDLRIEGEWPEVVAAWDAKDLERAFERLLGELDRGDDGERERVRRLMVALFEHMGQDDPTVTRYRRRLASALF
jgi:thioredoxin